MIDAVRDNDLHLDGVQLWSMRDGQVVCHGVDEPADPETYNLCLLQDGEMVYALGRQETAYGPGDIVVHDSSRPAGIRAAHVTCVGVEIPKAMAVT
ncbi:hypothetical protein [Saccharopolyspora shandongensis]|uniref:AraC-like ligand-binding domain-containing protein n=1 Tax=Saccharopolyspora shandongensis TaxID=418495 RepID=UPI0033DC01AC